MKKKLLLFCFLSLIFLNCKTPKSNSDNHASASKPRLFFVLLHGLRQKETNKMKIIEDELKKTFTNADFLSPIESHTIEHSIDEQNKDLLNKFKGLFNPNKQLVVTISHSQGSRRGLYINEFLEKQNIFSLGITIGGVNDGVEVKNTLDNIKQSIFGSEKFVEFFVEYYAIISKKGSKFKLSDDINSIVTLFNKDGAGIKDLSSESLSTKHFLKYLSESKHPKLFIGTTVNVFKDVLVKYLKDLPDDLVKKYQNELDKLYFDAIGDKNGHDTLLGLSTQLASRIQNENINRIILKNISHFEQTEADPRIIEPIVNFINQYYV